MRIFSKVGVSPVMPALDQGIVSWQMAFDQFLSSQMAPKENKFPRTFP